MKKKQYKIGPLLVQSLTTDQLAMLLDVIFAADGFTQYMDEFKKSDMDMADTVKKVSASAGNKKISTSTETASLKRTIQYWDSLWNRWSDKVFEVGDEEGKYAERDEHWEPPYFDGYSLAEDLETIATDMLDLIDDVHDQVNDPDLFDDALEEIESNISSYPEWMGVEHGEGCYLEENTTTCVIKWLWLSLETDDNSALSFLEKVNSMKNQHDMVFLHEDTVIDFFISLNDDACREIYKGLKAEKGSIDIHNTSSIWHNINHHYEEKFDNGKYLETCQKYLLDNWKYGQPLIDKAIHQKDFEKAESILGDTFASYLNLDKTSWFPESSLLNIEARYFPYENENDISDLLQIWADVSKKLGNLKRSAAARLQSVIHKTSDDMEIVIYEYSEMATPKIKKVIEPLFVQWQTETVLQSINHSMDTPDYSDTWIHWVIEASLNQTKKKPWFTKKMDTWFAKLKKDGKYFKRQWPLLARLTIDLADSSSIQKDYPFFYDIVLPGESAALILTKSRRKKLQAISSKQTASAVMDVWKNCLHIILPDPSNAYKADYTPHAQWLKALFELNGNEYDKIVGMWRMEHKRRKNLWRDIKKHHLPV